MRYFYKFQPDMVTFRKEGRGRYISTDGLCKCEKVGNQWTAAVRRTIDEAWVEDTRYAWSALHAAQDECRRMKSKGV
jgi:hypothetical protein